MTPAELKQQMEQLVEGTHPRQHQVSRGYILNSGKWSDDEEMGHNFADELLVATLRELGYGEAMDIYEAQTKWYA